MKKTSIKTKSLLTEMADYGQSNAYNTKRVKEHLVKVAQNCLSIEENQEYYIGRLRDSLATCINRLQELGFDIEIDCGKVAHIIKQETVEDTN